MPVVRIGEARAEAGPEGARASGRLIPLSEVNVESALSAMAACMAKKALESVASGRVEVAIHYYADIDKILEGREEIEYVEVEVVGSGGGCSEEKLRSGVESCPLFSLIEAKVKKVIARCEK